MTRCVGLLSGYLCLTNVAAAQNAVKPAQLTLVPCEIAAVKGDVRCGTYEVFENRAAGTGRKITLKILVLRSTGSEREPDPVVYIAGGPGSSATEDAPGVAAGFVKVRERRDLVFVDQRGTGGSHPLNCDFFNPSDPQSYFGYFYPLDDVRKCRVQLERKADLTLYTTAIAMDDLDEVRAALGYEHINLLGASYGTRAALVYLKRHPDHVRTVTLQGVAPTSEFMPLSFAKSNERALQGILAECAADEACNRAFPHLREETRLVLDRLLRGPIEVELRIPGSAPPSHPPGEAPKVKLSRDLAAEAIRYMLYGPRSASRVPLLLHLAAQGDFGPLAQAAHGYRRGLVAGGSNGLYLSITCAEDLPWIKPGEGERLAAATFLGDYRLRQQREACALWPRGSVSKEYSQPTKASTPVLMLTGEWDPVTPPSNADSAAKHLPNSLQVVVPHGGHGFGGLQGTDCIDRLQTDFIERGTAKGLDTSCVTGIKRRGFALQ